MTRPAEKNGPLKPLDGSFAHPVERLEALMARLRDPETGCPWDVAQDFKSIAPHTIEEAYEVADAIDRGDMDNLKEELGDLLMNIAFHAQMAAEAGHFTLNDVIEALVEKMIARHPHVFGDVSAQTADDVSAIWEARKALEKPDMPTSAMDGLTRGLPALTMARKIMKKAAKAGFVWPDKDAAFAKVEEEIREFRNASKNDDLEAKTDEYGDILISLVNYAHMLGIDSEEALRKANAKFEFRFRGMESDLKKTEGKTLKEVPLQKTLEFWARQKKKSAT